MSALNQQITFPNDNSNEAVRARVGFRMMQPLNDILLCVKNTLQSMEMGDIPRETERFLLTVPAVDPLHLDATKDCSTCGQEFDPADYDYNDTSSVRSPSLLLRLPCKHIICHGCLKAWLAKAGSCPICRYKLTERVFVEDEKDPRTEANAPSILKPILNIGLRWLATVPDKDDTEENTFGEFCQWAVCKETADQCAAMSALGLFGAFSTSVEDARLQSEAGQRWIAEFRRERGSERQVADEDADEDEDGNDNLGDRYETDSEDERRRREEELDTNTSYVASTVRERDQPVSDWEDFEHHDRFIRWDTNDEDEEEVAAEGEENE